MRHLTSADIRKATGLSRASISRKAPQEIPGAFRVDGVHFAFRDCPELREWMKEQKQKRNRLRSPSLAMVESPAMTSAILGARKFYAGCWRLIQSGRLQPAAEVIATMQEILRELEVEIESAELPPDERRDPERRLIDHLMIAALSTKPLKIQPRSRGRKAKP
jgi:hypothetical protein